MYSILIGGLALLTSSCASAAQVGEQSSPSSPVPRAPLHRYVTSDDFPAGVPRSAARPVEVALRVGPDGRVIECVIIASSRSSMLDHATCRLLRSRARFVPARNAAGTPIAGEVRTVLDWTKLASGTPHATGASEQRITLAPWESISRLRFRLGQIASCQWQTGGLAPPPPSSNACQNPGLAGMAARLAAENGVDFNQKELVVTLRMTGDPGVAPSGAVPSALADLAADLQVGADGQLSGCTLVRDTVRTSSPQRPDCRLLFRGPYVPATDLERRPKAVSKRAEMRVEVR